jgi:raffinose/stachyose/melibiose transport system substrate-binding protein
MRSKKARIIPILVAFGLAAAACGGDDDAADEPAADEPAADEPAADEPAADEPAADEPAASGLEGKLRVLIHQNPAGVEFFENFNDEFETANPDVEIDLTIVEAGDIAGTNQTRLTAKDIDVTTISVTGFANPVEDYMVGADTPYWQQLIEAGLLLDLSGQPYLANYDEPAVESSSFDGGVYAVSLGRTTYSGMFVNLDLLAEVGIETPTTFPELVSACDAVKDAA